MTTLAPDGPSNSEPHGPVARLIGLTGIARSGKDTTADFLVTAYGFVKHSFAGPIRDFMARILALDAEGLERAKDAPVDWLAGKTPRQIMQSLGTDWGRDTVDPDLWLKSCLRRVRLDLQANRRVVISDVRFDNEATAIQEIPGGTVWQITRAMAGPRSAHASESGVSAHHLDVELANDGSISELHDRIRAALSRPAAPRRTPRQ